MKIKIMKEIQPIRDYFAPLHPNLITRVALPSGERLSTYLGFEDFHAAIAFLYEIRHQFVAILRERVCPFLVGAWEIELIGVLTEHLPTLWSLAANQSK